MAEQQFHVGDFVVDKAALLECETFVVGRIPRIYQVTDVLEHTCHGGTQWSLILLCDGKMSSIVPQIGYISFDSQEVSEFLKRLGERIKKAKEDEDDRWEARWKKREEPNA